MDQAKWSDDTFAPGFKAFSSALKHFKASTVQLVATLNKPRESPHGTSMENGAEWLAKIDFAPFYTRNRITL